MARAAAAAQDCVAQQGDVVACPDGLAAMRAMRRWMNDGLVARQARDAHIEEAAEGQAKQRDKNSYCEIKDQHRA